MATTGTSVASGMPNSELQLRYTELLEKRIAQLEALVNETAKSSDAGKNESKTEDSQKTEAARLEKEKVTENESKGDDKKEDKATPGGRYRNILRKWDSTTGSHKDEVVGEANKKPDLKDVAYTFRRVYDPETGEKGAYSDLDIEDEGLIGLLRSVIDSKYPGINFDGDMVNMSAPFAPIISLNYGFMVTSTN